MKHSVEVCKLSPPEKNKSLKECLQGRGGSRWWRLGTHDLSKKDSHYRIQMTVVRECDPNIAKVWDFIFKSWNPGCFHGIS